MRIEDFSNTLTGTDAEKKIKSQGIARYHDDLVVLHSG